MRHVEPKHSLLLFALLLLGCETWTASTDRVQRVEAEECKRILVIYETQREGVDSKVTAPPVGVN